MKKSTVKSPTKEKNIKKICKEVKEYLRSIHELIKHEDQLLNHRLTWMWTLQGLLFTAIGFLWKSSDFPVIVIACVGLASCLTIGYSIRRGMAAILQLLNKAGEYKKLKEVDCNLPPTIGSRSKAITWLLPGYSLPWIIGLAWIALIAYRIV